MISVLLDLDPNVVKPGWTALIVTLLLAAAIVLLYKSMRRQLRKISIPRETTDDQPVTAPERKAGTSTE